MRFLATGTANVIPFLKCILLHCIFAFSFTHTHTHTHFTLISSNFSTFKCTPNSPVSFSSSSNLICYIYQINHLPQSLSSSSSSPPFQFGPFSVSRTAAGGSAARFPSLQLYQVLLYQKKTIMNHCGIHQKNTFASSPEEMRSMVCPKPRRLSLLSTTINEPIRPLRWQMCHMSDVHESKTGPELLDAIFAKGSEPGGYGAPEQICTQVASPPPFFSGSPPSRVSNPLIQDARFGDGKISPLSPRSMIPNPASSSLQSSPSSSRKGGCHFSNKPAVRIEGFDCLDPDNRRNCSILSRA